MVFAKNFDQGYSKEYVCKIVIIKSVYDNMRLEFNEVYLR
jgi:hypothetical protein